MNRRPGRDGPRTFVDRVVPGRARPDVNPYLALHREYGAELLPADEAPSWRGRWSVRSGRSAPLHVELGTGTGTWLAAMATLHPEWDWLGVEIRFKRCVQTASRLRAAGARHAAVVRYSWFSLDDLLTEGSLAGLHVNHPDPWAGSKERKHRLVGSEFLDDAARWLADGAELRLKTDFSPHVDALLAALPGRPFELVGLSRDVARYGPPWTDEVVTAYQAAFDRKGVPVHAVRIARRR